MMAAVPTDLHVHLTITVSPPLDPNTITQPILAALASSQGAIVSEVDDALAAVTAEFDTFRADLDRELTDLGNLVAGHLTPEQQAAFDALSARFAAATAAVDAADPTPPPAG